MKSLVLGAVLLLAAPVAALAQRADTVFFEDLTFDETREAIRGGATTVIVAAGGLEEGVRPIASGRRTDVVTVAADRIARALGGTLVAPVIAYGPDGPLPISAAGYSGLLEAAATSARNSGFRRILLLGESAGIQGALKAVADRLDAAWKGDGIRVVHLSDYDVKARADQDAFLARTLKFTPAGAAQRGAFVETSELLAINAQRVRLDLTADEGSAVAAPQYGQRLLTLKVDAAVAQATRALGITAAPSASVGPGARVLPTPDPRAAASSAPSSSTLFLEDLTPAEIRAAVASGKKVLIVPTGGTEKNGFHMALGKHNFHVRAGAALMAARLGNALVAPVLQYVPESQATEANPGVLSCARECFEPVVESIARAAGAAGFTDVLLIGDNGGNQTPLNTVAEKLNREWDGKGIKAYALTDFYEKGHEYQDVWFLSQFGWDSAVVGSHAGIKDTSQMLYVKPESVRTSRIAASFANQKESSISGDPTKATAEFGRIGLEFKVNGAIAQYRALAAPPQRERGRRRADAAPEGR